MTKVISIITAACLLGLFAPPRDEAVAQDFPTHRFIVYGVYNRIFMGNEGEVPLKDLYINMGTDHGITNGSRLIVFRKEATYDALGKRLFKDMTFPIGQLRVIHAEDNAAIARLVYLFPEDQTPALNPKGVIVGDIVRRMREK